MGVQKFVIYVLTAVLSGTGITAVLSGGEWWTDSTVLIGLAITAVTAGVAYLTYVTLAPLMVQAQ